MTKTKIHETHNVYRSRDFSQRERMFPTSLCKRVVTYKHTVCKQCLKSNNLYKPCQKEYH